MPNPNGVFDPKIFKLTLPVGAKGKPTELSGTQLLTYESDYCRRVGDAVQFRAPVNGVTTANSKNCRSELRELKPDGKTLASWSSTDGVLHTLIQDMTFTRLPTGNAGVGVVGGQIHDADDDVVVWRCELAGLWLAIGDHREDWKLIDPSYELGTRISTAFVVDKGRITAYYNGKAVHSFGAKVSGCYFRAGAYTQANAGAKPFDSTNYGETAYYGVRVVHGPVPGIPAPAPVPQPVPVPEPGTAPDATVIMVRHGEKPPDSGPPYGVTAGGVQDTHSLTTRGWARAGALVNLFNGYSRAMPKPSAIYASKGSTASMRPAQTVQFVAHNLGLAPITRYDLEVEPEFAAMVAEIRVRPGVTLVSAEHSKITDFVRALTGLDAPEWPSDRFDVCWILTRKDGVWSSRRIPQNLLPGDRTTTTF